MTPCGVSWCVALIDTQFCSAHTKNQALHPTVFNLENALEEAADDAYAEGFEDGKKESYDEGYERGLADHD